MVLTLEQNKVCVHYWLIESMEEARKRGTAKYSMGTCRFCGEEKEFANICDLESGGRWKTGWNNYYSKNDYK